MFRKNETLPGTKGNKELHVNLRMRLYKSSVCSIDTHVRLRGMETDTKSKCIPKWC